MLTATLIFALCLAAGALTYLVATKLDARDRAAGRFMPTGGDLAPRQGTTGRLLF